SRASLSVGVAGNAPAELIAALKHGLGKLPMGPGFAATQNLAAHKPQGIEVTRAHPDFPALLIARTWLGEHRSSMSHLYERIREVRGMNYGDYAYIEAFPRGMYQFFPDPNIARRAQIFEIWIRPVLPQNAHMALKIALFELGKMIDNGLTQEQFESTRNYLMKNVYLLTATQDQRLGYALDSRWYGIAEYTAYLREQLAKLSVDDVNRAIKKHLQTRDLKIVVITKDAAALREALVSDAFAEIAPEAIVITPVTDVFAR
ncbi:MAG: insulinase family protein, partial [Vicinamibacteria bacterium]|nr:insulinase family protein [Vicinamibacteria bacterium]